MPTPQYDAILDPAPCKGTLNLIKKCTHAKPMPLTSAKRGRHHFTLFTAMRQKLEGAKAFDRLMGLGDELWSGGCGWAG